MTVAEQTKENIIHAFWRLYMKQPIQKIKVTKVCEEAGYNRSTFYEYFQDVYDVLDYIEEQTISAVELQQAIQAVYRPDIKPQIVLQNFIRIFEDNSEYLPFLASEYGDPAFRRKLLIKLYPTMGAFFHSAIEKDEKQFQYIIEFQSSAILNTIAKWYENGKDIPVEQLIELLLDLTWRGTKNILSDMIANK